MIKRKGNRFTGFLLFVGLIGLSLIQSACDTTPSQAAASTPIEATIADTLVQATDIYGIPLDIYHIQEGKVGRNQTLSDLLQPLGLTLQEIYHISQLPDSLVNERKIKQGNRYLFYSKADTVSELPLFAESVFIYEKDLLNFVAISIDPDTLWARNGQKPVKTRLQVASGTIETSLWESMLATDANPMLAIELSEIFAWTIDFFGIQQGDRYKVIYEESFVDSNSLGIDKITGAWFYHNENDFWTVSEVSLMKRETAFAKHFLRRPSGFQESVLVFPTPGSTPY